MAALPPAAAWRHFGREDLAREGFEVLYVSPDEDGWTFEGMTSGVEEGRPFAVIYKIDVDRSWRTLSARIATPALTIRLETEGDGRWLLDGNDLPEADGCLDLDLESSAFTNAFPMHRLALPPRAEASAPAVYVRQDDLRVERLEQRYEHLGNRLYAYASPGFQCELQYDAAGLVLEYPGIASRVALEAP